MLLIGVRVLEIDHKQCDLHSGACGQCVRANVTCSGYRDTQRLRIQNESHAIVKKAGKKFPSEPQCLPVSIDAQARDAFYIYYATGGSKCWAVLTRYYHPTDVPAHLTAAIEALSCAYLWHVVGSDVALATGRKAYVKALQLTNRALEQPKDAIKDTTLLSTLLLDLFEKITERKPLKNKSWTVHVDGALALVKLRGLENFRSPSEYPVLIRLINHHITSSIANASRVPDEVLKIQDYITNDLNVEDHTLRLSHIAVQYAILRNSSKKGLLSKDQNIEFAARLDMSLQALELNMPQAWRYSTTFVGHESDRAYDLYFDTYPHRNICSARNFVRIVRIFLNESLIGNCSESPSGEDPLPALAYENIGTLARQICACVPQFVDCAGPAQQRLPHFNNSEAFEKPTGVPSSEHSHTLHHQADCHSLIFPLYVAGRSPSSPKFRLWIIKQLHYMGSHFYIRHAELVAQMLEQQTNTDPWEVYSMLGAYAFNA